MINLSYLMSVLVREGGGGGGTEFEMKCLQLWALMLCVVQLIMQTLPSKIFLDRCFEMIIYITIVEPHLLATLLTQPHPFYSHFILTQTKAQLVLFYL